MSFNAPSGDCLPIVLNRNSEPILVPNSHHPQDLTEAIINWLYQDLELYPYHPNKAHGDCRVNITRLYEEDLAKACTKWPTKQGIQDYFTAFDSIFFAGALRNFTNLEVVDREIELPSGKGPFNDGLDYGITVPQHSTEHPHNILIKIWDWHDYYYDFTVRRQGVINTLLHEMIHGLFMIYECPSDALTIHRTEGFTGHGPSWARLFREVRQKIQRSPCLAEQVDYDVAYDHSHVDKYTSMEADAAKNLGFCDLPLSRCFCENSFSWSKLWRKALDLWHSIKNRCKI